MIREGEDLKGMDKKAVKKVIEEAYVKGIHGDQEMNRVKSGFHKDFAMLVLSDNQIDKVTVDEWLRRITSMKEENPQLWKSKTSHNFRLIDITKNAA
ncbi:MAG: nuclear transport factor 2 family protein, partial [Candidatus Korarchaeota archaeon]|nr:nuclear transport factor 2 family protein [Candidatus Korarchaeota archaeon]